MKPQQYGRIIVIKRTGADGANFPLTIKSCVIGRHTDCDIRIQLPTVSLKHCTLEVDTHTAEVKLVNHCADRPALLNYKPVLEHMAMRHADLFTVADRSFRFEYPNESPFYRQKKPTSPPKVKLTPKIKNHKRVTHSPKPSVTPAMPSAVSANKVLQDALSSAVEGHHSSTGKQKVHTAQSPSVLSKTPAPQTPIMNSTPKSSTFKSSASKLAKVLTPRRISPQGNVKKLKTLTPLRVRKPPSKVLSPRRVAITRMKVGSPKRVNKVGSPARGVLKLNRMNLGTQESTTYTLWSEGLTALNPMNRLNAPKSTPKRPVSPISVRTQALSPVVSTPRSTQDITPNLVQKQKNSPKSSPMSTQNITPKSARKQKNSPKSSPMSTKNIAPNSARKQQNSPKSTPKTTRISPRSSPKIASQISPMSSPLPVTPKSKTKTVVSPKSTKMATPKTTSPILASKAGVSSKSPQKPNTQRTVNSSKSPRPVHTESGSNVTSPKRQSPKAGAAAFPESVFYGTSGMKNSLASPESGYLTQHKKKLPPVSPRTPAVRPELRKSINELRRRSVVVQEVMSTPPTGSGKKRKSSESLSATLLPSSKRKRVSFGPKLSPEQFNKYFPPTTPIRRGKMPQLRHTPSGATPRSLIKPDSLFSKTIKEESPQSFKTPSPKRKTVVTPMVTIHNLTDTPSPSPKRGRPKSVSPSQKQGKTKYVSPPPKRGRPKSVSPSQNQGKSKSVSPSPKQGRPRSVSPLQKQGKSKSVGPSPRHRRPRSVNPSPKKSRSKSSGPLLKQGKLQVLSSSTEQGRPKSISPTTKKERVLSVSPSPRKGRPKSVSPPAKHRRSTSVKAIKQRPKSLPLSSPRNKTEMNISPRQHLPNTKKRSILASDMPSPITILYAKNKNISAGQTHQSLSKSPVPNSPGQRRRSSKNTPFDSIFSTSKVTPQSSRKHLNKSSNMASPIVLMMNKHANAATSQARLNNSVSKSRFSVGPADSQKTLLTFHDGGFTVTPMDEGKRKPSADVSPIGLRRIFKTPKRKSIAADAQFNLAGLASMFSTPDSGKKLPKSSTPISLLKAARLVASPVEVLDVSSSSTSSIRGKQTSRRSPSVDHIDCIVHTRTPQMHTSTLVSSSTKHKLTSIPATTSSSPKPFLTEINSSASRMTKLSTSSVVSSTPRTKTSKSAVRTPRTNGRTPRTAVPSRGKPMLWSQVVKMGASKPALLRKQKTPKRKAVVPVRKSASGKKVYPKTPRAKARALAPTTGHAASPETLVIRKKLIKTPKPLPRRGRKSLVKKTRKLTMDNTSFSGFVDLLRTPQAVSPKSPKPRTADISMNSLYGDLPVSPAGPVGMLLSPLVDTQRAQKRRGGLQLVRLNMLMSGECVLTAATTKAASRVSSDSPSVSGIRNLFREDVGQLSPRLGGLRELVKSPRPSPRSPTLTGLRNLVKTPKVTRSPRLAGLRELMRSPRETGGIGNADLDGLADLFATPPTLDTPYTLAGQTSHLTSPEKVISPAHPRHGKNKVVHFIDDPDTMPSTTETVTETNKARPRGARKVATSIKSPHRSHATPQSIVVVAEGEPNPRRGVKRKAADEAGSSPPETDTNGDTKTKIRGRGCKVVAASEVADPATPPVKHRSPVQGEAMDTVISHVGSERTTRAGKSRKVTAGKSRKVTVATDDFIVTVATPDNITAKVDVKKQKGEVDDTPQGEVDDTPQLSPRAPRTRVLSRATKSPAAKRGATKKTPVKSKSKVVSKSTRQRPKPKLDSPKAAVSPDVAPIRSKRQAVSAKLDILKAAKSPKLAPTRSKRQAVSAKLDTPKAAKSPKLAPTRSKRQAISAKLDSPKAAKSPKLAPTRSKRQAVVEKDVEKSVKAPTTSKRQTVKAKKNSTKAADSPKAATSPKLAKATKLDLPTSPVAVRSRRKAPLATSMIPDTKSSPLVGRSRQGRRADIQQQNSKEKQVSPDTKSRKKAAPRMLVEKSKSSPKPARVKSSRTPIAAEADSGAAVAKKTHGVIAASKDKKATRNSKQQKTLVKKFVANKGVKSVAAWKSATPKKSPLAKRITRSRR